MPKRCVSLSGLACLLLLAVPGAAHPTLPGSNGTLFYTQYTTHPLPNIIGQPSFDDDREIRGNIRAMNADGSGDRAIVTSKDISEQGAAPSPDGREIVYSRFGTLFRSATDGTKAVELPDTRFADSPDWSPDGSTVVYAQEETGIRLVDPRTPGAKPRTIVAATAFDGENYRGGAVNIVDFATPQFTADGRSIVYSRYKVTLRRKLQLSTSIWMVGTDGSNPRQLFRGSGDARVVGPFSLSPDGTHLAYLATPTWKKEPRRLYVSRLDGSQPRLLKVASAGKTHLGTPAWSPDGSKIALSVNQSSSLRGGELWSVDAVTGAHTVLKKITKGLIDEPKWQTLPAPTPTS